MDLEKRYKTLEDIECNILQLVKIEPEWAANMIQYYEKEIDGQKANKTRCYDCEIYNEYCAKCLRQ